MKILVDTNVLMALINSKVDFARLLNDAYPEAKLFVLRQSLVEVKLKKPGIFSVVEGYLQKNRFEVIEGEGKADEMILTYALKEKTIVLTLDFALKKRLKKAGVQVITLKDSKLVL